MHESPAAPDLFEDERLPKGALRRGIRCSDHYLRRRPRHLLGSGEMDAHRARLALTAEARRQERAVRRLNRVPTRAPIRLLRVNDLDVLGSGPQFLAALPVTRAERPTGSIPHGSDLGTIINRCYGQGRNSKSNVIWVKAQRNKTPACLFTCMNWRDLGLPLFG